jgi:carbon storage regulator
MVAGGSMLYLTRRPGEAVIINNAIEVRVIEMKGRTVKLGFNFPPEASVLREEVFLQIKQANQQAAADPGALLDLPERKETSS